MTIQGSVTDPVRIAGYRDVILPMLKQLGAYYIVFVIAEGGSGYCAAPETPDLCRLGMAQPPVRTRLLVFG